MRVFLLAAALGAAAPRLAAQSAADGPVLGSAHLVGNGAVKIFNSAGLVRVIGWDYDSVLVRGRVPRSEHFAFNRARDSTVAAITLGIMDFGGERANAACTFVVFVPRHATVSVKTAASDIDARDVTGWFFSGSGTIRLAGSVASAQAETINGNLDIDLATAWVRARTGAGHLLLRGNPQDADVSTISGTLDVAAPALMRGQFASVSGDIRYDGDPVPGSIFEFSNHSGSVDLVLPANASGVFQLTSVSGAIENGVTGVRPVRDAHSLRVVLGRGTGGAQVAVRTFKGTIRLRPR